MATEITVQRGAAGGTIITFGTADPAGNEFVNDARTLLEVRVPALEPDPVTVTFVAVRPCNQGFLHDDGRDVAPGETRRFGPFEQQRFSANGDAKVQVTYSTFGTVDVAAFKTSLS